MPITVAVLGPESSGKSTLCVQLQKHYNATMVTEYARDYLTYIHRPYTADDVILMATKHTANIAKAISTKTNMVIIDTELINFKVWYTQKYGACHQWILQQLAVQSFDLILLLAPDVAYEKDALRENLSQEKRNELFTIYEAELIELNQAYKIIKGIGTIRTKNAIKAIDLLLQK